MPERVQLRRAKGWRMPENTVKVTRPGIWGNPFIVSPKVRPGARSGAEYICVPTVEDAVACFEIWLKESLAKHQGARDELAKLRGKNLACWCPIGSPCHADVILRLANEQQSTSTGKQP
jgi:hypothetical protein